MFESRTQHLSRFCAWDDQVGVDALAVTFHFYQ
jgi:hypothetical protein